MPSLTHDLGGATDVWARWDSVHFLRIAEHGYSTAETAFYPLYPALVAGLGRVFFGHYIVAGIVVSLAATLAAFVLLERLAGERLGAAGGRRAVLYLALFPTALFLQAVYSESLFLFLSLGAFALAERSRFAEAGAVAGLAILTRPTALALLPPLALLAGRHWWRLATALPIVAIYPLLLWRRLGDPWDSRTRKERGTGTFRRRDRSAGSGTRCAQAGPASSSLRRDRTPTSTGPPFRRWTRRRCAPRR